MERLDYSKMGQRIRRERKRCKWTQEELADKAGISLSFLGHIERGSRIPSVETLAQICRALHADMNAIVWGEAYRRTEEERKWLADYLRRKIEEISNW